MIVIYVAVLTVAAAKDAKGKYLNFTDNLEIYFQIYHNYSLFTVSMYITIFKETFL